MRVRGDDFADGVGGTVAATILMAETLAAHGWDVLVASAVDQELTVNRVRYAPVAAALGCAVDVALLVNSWGESAATVKARRRVFFYTDTRWGGHADSERNARWADIVLVQSPFGREQLRPALPAELAARMAVLPLPIRLGDYLPNHTKPGKQLLYSSMPDRGLVHLVNWFPRIRSRVPDAELHVTGDFSMYRLPSGQESYAKLFVGVEGVHYHGRVSRSQLVSLQQAASVLAFPCTFPEGFCIAAAEAMAAGAVPVTSDAFALSTTVGAAGVLIPGQPGGGRRRAIPRWLYGRRFVKAVTQLLSNQDYWQRKSSECRSTAENRFSPEAWRKAFLELVA
jgi:glycosyltransferase involved in cell wall biosynthesis